MSGDLVRLDFRAVLAAMLAAAGYVPEAGDDDEPDPQTAAEEVAP